MRTFFTGEYEKVIIKVGGQGIVVDEDAGIILPPKQVTELDRLSHVVYSVE
jgi:hypothetical protein